MKNLNDRSTAVFLKILSLLGGQDETVINRSKRFPAVHVERVGREDDFLGEPAELIKVAHYTRGNPDPEMVFIAVSGTAVFLAAYRLYVKGILFERESIFKDGNQYKYRQKWQERDTVVANDWLTDLGQQQGLSEGDVKLLRAV